MKTFYFISVYIFRKEKKIFTHKDVQIIFLFLSHLIFLHRPTTKTSIIFVRHNQNVFAVVFDFSDGEHADAYP